MLVLSPYVDDMSVSAVSEVCVDSSNLSLYSKSNMMKYNGNYDENMVVIIYRNALQQQCQQLGIAHRVHFLGLVEQMPRFYQGLDLFCLPSLAEGMPLCVLEAQACGVPVVMSAVGAAADIVCPASGQLLEERDPIRLAQLLAQGLLKSCGLRAATRAFVCEQGSLSQMAHAYQALYVR